MSPANPWFIWKESEHLWQDLAVVTMTTSIPESNIASTVFNLKNHPPTFRLPESKSMKDFLSLGTVLRKFHGVRDGDEGPSLFSAEAEPEVRYKVKVMTGRMLNAGTDADVFITFTG